MIQLIVNVNLLREIDERKLINAYARLVYNNEEDITDELKIKANLEDLLDWDKKGDYGLGIYCSKFETIKKKDWPKLVQLIKDNAYEIKIKAYPYKKKRKLEAEKVVLDFKERLEEHKKEYFSRADYKPNKKGKPAKSCTYNGKTYSSRQECIYKEGITKAQLYRYLKETNQI